MVSKISRCLNKPRLWCRISVFFVCFSPLFNHPLLRTAPGPWIHGSILLRAHLCGSRDFGGVAQGSMLAPTLAPSWFHLFITAVAAILDQGRDGMTPWDTQDLVIGFLNADSSLRRQFRRRQCLVCRYSSPQLSPVLLFDQDGRIWGLFVTDITPLASTDSQNKQHVLVSERPGCYSRLCGPVSTEPK